MAELARRRWGGEEEEERRVRAVDRANELQVLPLPWWSVLTGDLESIEILIWRGVSDVYVD